MWQQTSTKKGCGCLNKLLSFAIFDLDGAENQNTLSLKCGKRKHRVLDPTVTLITYTLVCMLFSQYTTYATIMSVHM